MQVWYLKSTVDESGLIRNEKRTDFMFGVNWCRERGTVLPSIGNITLDHDLMYVKESNDPLTPSNLEQIFHDFQGEFMEDEISHQVRSTPWRSHDSMSVGDIVVDHGKMWFCDSTGWTLISEEN